MVSHIILKILIKGRAAMMPPYKGNHLANSVTRPIMAAELIIFMNRYIILTPRLISLML